MLMSPDAGRLHIHRERRLNRPPLLRNLAELGPMLDNYRHISSIYQSTRIADDGSQIFIFGDNQMLTRLNHVTELHIDGTFKTVPRSPRVSQLLIIYMRKMDVGIPVAYILCSHRTRAVYNKVWQFLLEKAPNLVNTLRCIISDFEMAIISSIRQTFPLISIRGCWFHSIKAMTQKWNDLGLPYRENDLTLKQAWILALLPPERFPEALQIIAASAERIVDEYENVALFIRYLYTQWLPLANIMSVWNTPWRTNNIAEGFNKHLLTKLGGEHPSLFTFLARLIDIIADVELQWERLEAGIDVHRGRRVTQRRTDVTIRNIQASLESGRYTIEEFINSAINIRLHRDLYKILDLDQQDILLRGVQEMARLDDLLDPVDIMLDAPVDPQILP